MRRAPTHSSTGPGPLAEGLAFRQWRWAPAASQLRPAPVRGGGRGSTVERPIHPSHRGHRDRHSNRFLAKQQATLVPLAGAGGGGSSAISGSKHPFPTRAPPPPHPARSTPAGRRKPSAAGDCSTAHGSRVEIGERSSGCLSQGSCYRPAGGQHIPGAPLPREEPLAHALRHSPRLYCPEKLKPVLATWLPGSSPLLSVGLFFSPGALKLHLAARQCHLGTGQARLAGELCCRRGGRNPPDKPVPRRDRPLISWAGGGGRKRRFELPWRFSPPPPSHPYFLPGLCQSWIGQGPRGWGSKERRGRLRKQQAAPSPLRTQRQQPTCEGSYRLQGVHLPGS